MLVASFIVRIKEVFNIPNDLVQMSNIPNDLVYCEKIDVDDTIYTYFYHGPLTFNNVDFDVIGTVKGEIMRLVPKISGGGEEPQWFCDLFFMLDNYRINYFDGSFSGILKVDLAKCDNYKIIRFLEKQESFTKTLILPEEEKIKDYLYDKYKPELEELNMNKFFKEILV